jgi:hypothetical protein
MNQQHRKLKDLCPTLPDETDDILRRMIFDRLQTTDVIKAEGTDDIVEVMIFDDIQPNDIIKAVQTLAIFKQAYTDEFNPDDHRSLFPMYDNEDGCWVGDPDQYNVSLQEALHVSAEAANWVDSPAIETFVEIATDVIGDDGNWYDALSIENAEIDAYEDAVASLDDEDHSPSI